MGKRVDGVQPKESGDCLKGFLSRTHELQKCRYIFVVVVEILCCVESNVQRLSIIYDMSLISSIIKFIIKTTMITLYLLYPGELTTYCTAVRRYHII